MKRFNRKGFTLAELLIVVAIIAVLVAIAIPVFTSQLEKSREATDLANIRSAYAEVVVKAIDDDGTGTLEQEVKIRQTVSDWQTADAADTLKGICGNSSYVTGAPSKGGSATVTWVAATSTAEGHCTIAFSAAEGG